jgi:hypothetical protein
MYKGQVNAYKLLVNGQLRLYAQNELVKIGELTSASLYIKKQGLYLQQITELDYKKYLLNYTSDDPDSKEKVSSLVFNPKAIEKFISDYNHWFLNQK